MTIRSFRFEGQLGRLSVMPAVMLCLVWMPGLGQNLSTDIRLNQIGFYPDAQKAAAVVGSTSGSFTVMTPDLTESVFTGSLSVAKMWTPAQERVQLADFSELRDDGEYVIVVPDLGRSYPFEIRQNVHQALVTAAIKGYYFQRASTPLESAHAGRWARSAGHPDNEVRIHPSAASAERPAGSLISAPGGWYDAGDYNKYIVNSGISTGTLLLLYEHFPEYFGDLQTNIPESANGVPDLLDEILWNVRWMLAMQDPADGGVYTKLTTANFEGMVMPARANSTRYVVMKSTAATLDFAAVMALAARQFRSFEQAFPGLADSLLSAALAAWEWVQVNGEVPYDQGAMNRQFDPDINTGGYGDNSFFDEFRWAASELFITTNQSSFMIMYPPFQAPELSAPSWPYVDPLGFVSLAFHREDVATVVDTTEIAEALLRLANQYVNIRRESPLGTVMGASSGDFYWGSNSLAANQGVILIQAYRLTAEPKYLDAALANLDYLLGRNGTGYSFLTGHGDRTPMHPHHRQSQADGVTEPVPGLLVGGPNPGRQDGCNYPSDLPAKSYLDDVCSYASNEIAINWNAPLAYLAGAIEAILSPTGRPVSTEPEISVPDRGSIDELQFGPNPASDRLKIEFVLDEPAQVSIRLLDVLGREIARPADRRTLGAGPHGQTLDLHSLPAGRYAIMLEKGTERLIRLATVVR